MSKILASPVDALRTCGRYGYQTEDQSLRREDPQVFLKPIDAVAAAWRLSLTAMKPAWTPLGRVAPHLLPAICSLPVRYPHDERLDIL